MAVLRLDLTKVDRDLEGNYDTNQFAQVEYADPLAEVSEPSPLQKLKQYCQNEDPGEREMVVRLILDAVDDIKSYADFELILEIAFALANDIDPEVRSRVLSTIGTLLDKNADVTTDEECRLEYEERLCEVPLRMMTDFNQQVRKVSQNVIVSLLAQNKARDTFTRHLCAVMVHCLGRDENCDVRGDTLLLVSRVASLLGRDLCLVHFVPLLPFLATDTIFNVRKVLAMTCSELCHILGEGTVDDSVLPFFLHLCQDDVWGVRKACVEVYAEVAACCTMETRYSLLTPAFLKLLRDDSKWVRKTAYQTLGPFISTFYNPESELNKSSDVSLEPLGDSILRDNSLLNTSASLTTDSPQGGREACPLPGGKDSSTPGGGTGVGEETSGFLGGRDAPPLSKGNDTCPSLGDFCLSPESKEFGTPPSGGTGPPEGGLGTKAVPSGTMSGSPFPATNLSPVLAGLGLVEGSTSDETHQLGLPARRRLDAELTDLDHDNGGSGDPGTMNKKSLNNPTESGVPGEVGGPIASQPCTSQPAPPPVGQPAPPPVGQPAPPPVGLEEDNDDDLLPFLMDLPTETPENSKGIGLGESSPIRVFVQSENGHMTEHDLSLGPDEMYGDASPDRTCINSVSMDLTMNGDQGGSAMIASAFHQEIVPDELMEIYLSIMEQGRSQSADGELQYHCAFSLPAVVRTLGKPHWQLIKPIFNLLAVDQNWKIRRVLAFSLHELARVLGLSLICSDLVPVLMEICTKDIDEVKIGVLSHLAEFFELLPSYVRIQKLAPTLLGLLNTENERNWRYRHCLAEQLAMLCSMLDFNSIQTHIAPVALTLAEDKVSEVRKAANSLLGVVLQCYFEASTDSGCGLLKTLKDHNASHGSYSRRLMYVRQVESFLSEGRVSNEVFATHCLPTLLILSCDRVSNVRLSVARVLKDTVSSIDYFKMAGCNVPFSPAELEEVGLSLQKDKDRDVRYFAGNTNPVCIKKEEEEEEEEEKREEASISTAATYSVEGVGSEEEFYDVEAAKC